MRDWQDYTVRAERAHLILQRVRERLMPEMTAYDEEKIRAFLLDGHGTFLAVGSRAFLRKDLERLAKEDSK